jgi:hypothetical protein
MCIGKQGDERYLTACGLAVVSSSSREQQQMLSVYPDNFVAQAFQPVGE